MILLIYNVSYKVNDQTYNIIMISLLNTYRYIIFIHNEINFNYIFELVALYYSY